MYLHYILTTKNSYILFIPSHFLGETVTVAMMVGTSDGHPRSHQNWIRKPPTSLFDLPHPSSIQEGHLSGPASGPNDNAKSKGKYPNDSNLKFLILTF